MNGLDLLYIVAIAFLFLVCASLRLAINKQLRWIDQLAASLEDTLIVMDHQEHRIQVLENLNGVVNSNETLLKEMAVPASGPLEALYPRTTPDV